MTLSSDYHIVYSRRRTLAIVISKGRVTVRAPIGCNIAHIQQMISAKQPWISRHLLRQQAQPPRLSWQQRGEILFRGELLQVVFSRATKSDVYLADHKLLISVSQRVTAEKLVDWHNKLLGRWLLAQATAQFGKSLTAWASIMDLSYRELRLGQWQRRWGYCDSKGVIGLNWRLIMAPAWVSDYVIVHELAHIMVMNHSPQFWQKVSRYVPDYQQAQAWLSYNHQQLTE